MNTLQTLSCSNCGASLPTADTPTLTCTHCGTVMVNPFYQDQAAQPLAMPQIHIVVQNVIEQANAPAIQGVAERPFASLAPPRGWLSTTLLAIFFGVFGAHRFYTGYTLEGIVQLFTLGGFGIWLIIDLLLLLTGNYHDKHGRAIKPANKRAFFIVLAVILGLCLLFMLGGGTNAPSATPVP